MEVNKKDLKGLSQKSITKIINQISEEERKRLSLPEPELSDIEMDILKEIAKGYSRRHLERVVKLYAKIHNTLVSYQSITAKLIRKFEATTLAHVVYKAMKIGLIE